MRGAVLRISGVVTLGVLTAVGCTAFGSDDDAGTGAAPEAGAPGEGGDSAPGPDGGGTSPNPGVFCGSKYCDPTKELCCVNGSVSRECLSKNDPTVCKAYAFACDDGADCPARTVCCGGLGSGETAVFGTTCLPLLDCKKTMYWVVICDPNAAAPCPGGAACHVPDGGGYGYCDGLHY